MAARLARGVLRHDPRPHPGRVSVDEHDHRVARRLRHRRHAARRRAGGQDLRRIADVDQLRARGRHRFRGDAGGVRTPLDHHRSGDAAPRSTSTSRRSRKSLADDLKIAAERSQSVRAARAAANVQRAVIGLERHAPAADRAAPSRDINWETLDSYSAIVDQQVDLLVNYTAGDGFIYRQTARATRDTRDQSQPGRHGACAVLFRRVVALAAGAPHHRTGGGRLRRRRAHRRRQARRANPARQRRRAWRPARRHAPDARQHQDHDGARGGAAPLGAERGSPMRWKARARASWWPMPTASSRSPIRRPPTSSAFRATCCDRACRSREPRPADGEARRGRRRAVARRPVVAGPAGPAAPTDAGCASAAARRATAASSWSAATSACSKEQEATLKGDQSAARCRARQHVAGALPVRCRQPAARSSTGASARFSGCRATRCGPASRFQAVLELERRRRQSRRQDRGRAAGQEQVDFFGRTPPAPISMS